MSIPTKIRALLSGDIADVKILISHPMETGSRKGPDGKLIPANFIRNLTVTIGGKTYLDAEWGGGVSKDPYLNFHAKGVRTGDKIVISYEDNAGNRGSSEGTVR